MRCLSLTSLIALSSLFSEIGANAFELIARQNCAQNYIKCSPSGATATDTPPVGGALSSLYIDILDSISGVKLNTRAGEERPQILDVRASSNAVCCMSLR